MVATCYFEMDHICFKNPASFDCKFRNKFVEILCLKSILPEEIFFSCKKKHVWWTENALLVTVYLHTFQEWKEKQELE